ncbi:hypothetical protein ACP26F_08530 [Franconibacter pulveris 1160]|uniref:hypothetical protein n=1 Tax=Franconibacter pulveris TaxID=435910 RepID=UPI000464FF04|nr:hypothetical protein [Franconibacter pulveris]
MKNFGWLLSLIGVLLGIYALLMDVTVPAGDGTNVVNFGLLSLRQNLVIIAGFLFLGGLIVSALRRKRPVPVVDFTELDRIDSEYFVIHADSGDRLDILAIDRVTLMLLGKYSKSSVSDIMLMSRPLIDKWSSSLPVELQKDFRRQLEDRLKQNS